MFSPRHLISSSVYDRPNILICDLAYIYECARVCRQKLICISSIDNTMYATNEEPCGIHEIKLPFATNTDLLLVSGINSTNCTVANSYDKFFIPDQFPWAIVPEYYWDMYRAGDIVTQYDIEADLFILYDKSTMKPIDVIYRYKATQEMLLKTFIDVLDGFFIRRFRCINPIQIKDLHLDSVFQNGFFEQKSIFGGFNVILDYYGKRIPLTFYKGMIALTKSDKLDAIIYEDGYIKGIYIVELNPIKKKDSIKGNKYGIPFSEKAYFCYKGI